MNKSINPSDLGSQAIADDLLSPVEPAAFNAVSPPIFQTSLFTYDSYEAMEDVFAGRARNFIYSRGDNPTVREFELLVARLEGAEDGRAFSSGTAAITSTILSIVEAGDRVVAVRHLYNDVYRLLVKLLGRLGVAVDFVDPDDHDEVRAALSGAKMLYLENPSSMVFELQDIAALAAMAKEAGVTTVIDNSWATPLFQKPIRHGVDIVIHAASKYMGGHSDTVAGVVVGTREAMAKINATSYPYVGAKLSPFEAWLLLRGLRTLRVRLREHERSGLLLAERLNMHPAIARVRHPAFQDHPGKSTLLGYSGLFSFDLNPDIDVASFVNALREIRLGVSWGGPETLVVPAKVALQIPDRMTSFIRFGVSEQTVRFAVGLEEPELLWSDLQQALHIARR
ncbi:MULTISPECIES: PLP-dependent transferase [unclassified Sinorhizobium]|uniref:PLP-dependent transferase n=1 Tax=unclassified Sinorhizobium TaxID=2613772 RepID=UPI003525B606